MIRVATACLIGLCVLSASCSETPTQSAPVSETAPFESAYFTVSIEGAGPDVLLVPGLASSAAVWDGTKAALGDRYTFHTVQVSGFAGAPARGNADNSDILDDLARDLSAYSQQLDEPATLVGHSLGGLVALKTALSPDSAFERFVIVDVLPFFSVLMDDAATADSMGPVAGFMKATLLSQSDEEFSARQDEALAALVQAESDRALALAWSVESDRAVMAQAMSEVLVTDLRREISTIASPVTVIYARHPDIPNMDAVEQFYLDLYAAVDDASVRPVDDALHFIMLDQPDAFTAALADALERR